MFSDSPLDCLVSSKKKGEHGTINVRRGNCHGFGGFYGNNRCKPRLLVVQVPPITVSHNKLNVDIFINSC